jgi:hypothetical protein
LNLELLEGDPAIPNSKIMPPPSSEGHDSIGELLERPGNEFPG